MGIELFGGGVKFGVDFFPPLSSFVGDSTSLCSFGGLELCSLSQVDLNLSPILLCQPSSVGIIGASYIPSQGLEFLATSFFWQVSVTCKAETHDRASWWLVGLLPLEVSSSSA